MKIADRKWTKVAKPKGVDKKKFPKAAKFPPFFSRSLQDRSRYMPNGAINTSKAA